MNAAHYYLLMTLKVSSKLNLQQIVRYFKPTSTTYTHGQTDAAMLSSAKMHSDYTYQMTVDGLPVDLDTTHTEKDLGVYVDDKLKFDFHSHTEVTRATHMLGLVKRSYTFLDKGSLLCLYKAMSRPILTVWSPYRKCGIDAVESVQRRATRILPQLRGLDYEARLLSLKLPILTYRRLRGDVINV